MDKPTICVECKHITPTIIKEFKCAASHEERMNFVTGRLERMEKRGEWAWCHIKNQAGKCPDFEAKGE